MLNQFTMAQVPASLLVGLAFGFFAAAFVPGVGTHLKLITSFLIISFMLIFGFIFDVTENYALGSNFLASHLFNWLTGCICIYPGIWARLKLDKKLEDYYTERAKNRSNGYTAVPDKERSIRSVN
jgi:hypothetical protein